MTDWTEMNPQEITQMILEKIWDIEVGELIECEICHREIPSTDAYAVLDNTYVCDPDLDERCLWEWNNQNSFPTQLATYFHD